MNFLRRFSRFQPSIVEVTSPIENLEVLNSGSDDENLNLDVCASDTEFGTKGRTPKLSRLHSEFQELEWLGKGGYGDVVKVNFTQYIVIDSNFKKFI